MTGKKKFLILAALKNDLNPNTGSGIRIKGYTDKLSDLNVKYTFMARTKPDYLPVEKFKNLKLNSRLAKIIILHNLCFHFIALRWLSHLLYFFLQFIPDLKNLKKYSLNTLVWAHQENITATYLKIRFKRKIILDVHGILHIQKENKEGMNPWKKLWFRLSLFHEKIAFPKMDYINDVSSQMKQYIQENFSPNGKIFLAPDGIPDRLENYRYNQQYSKELCSKYGIPNDKPFLLFAGSLKKIGGVQDLVRTYIQNNKLNSKFYLVLIGKGQMENYVEQLAYKNDLNHKIIRIQRVPHDELVGLMHASRAIICPDIGNEYNYMVPHIKLFDAVASGSFVISPGFEVNKEAIDPVSFQNVLYYEPDNTTDLTNTILRLPDKPKPVNQEILTHLTYDYHLKEYLNNYFL